MSQGFERQKVSVVFTSGNKVVQAALWEELVWKRYKKQHFISQSIKGASQVLFENTGTYSVLNVKIL